MSNRRVIGLLSSVIVGALWSAPGVAEVPPAPAPSLPHVQPLPIRIGLPAPQIVFPTSTLPFEEEEGLSFKNVYVSWSYPSDVEKLHHFDVCYWKEGMTCGPLSEMHYGRSTPTRHATLGIPIMAGRPAWKWAIGACPISGNCSWSAEQTVRTAPRMGKATLNQPALGASLTVPGTLLFTWSEVPGAESYLFCHHRPGWACQDFPTTNWGDSLAVYKTDKPIFTKTYTTYTDSYEMVGSQPSQVRQWQVRACHTVQTQQQDQPPTEVVRCSADYETRSFTVSKTPPS